MYGCVLGLFYFYLSRTSTLHTKARLHTCANRGFKGIQADMEIKAFDQNKVFAEKAGGKPLSAADAAMKYGISKGSARNYIEFEVPKGSVEVIKNPITQATEYTIKGNVKLNPLTTKFIKRR